MDPFEDFEFKPLTEGLGFQRKSRKGGEPADNDAASKAETKVMSSAARANSPNSLRDNPAQNGAGSKKEEATNWGENALKRPTHSKNISDIISSLPSLEMFDGSEGGSDVNGSILTSSGEKAAEAKPNGARTAARLEKPFGGHLARSGKSEVAPAMASAPRPSFTPPRPGTPTVPGVAAIAQMAAAASGDIMGTSTSSTRARVGTPTVSREKVAPTPPAASAIANVGGVAGTTAAVAPAANVAISDEVAKPVVLKKTAISLVAMILDGIMVTGFALLFLVALLLVTKVHLSALMINFQSDLMTQVAAAALIFSVQQVYLILSRSFYGCTMGEWAFDMQLGNDAQHKRAYYPILVAWRSLVIVLLGGLILPLLSIIFRLDLAYYFSGLQMYKRDSLG